MLNSRHTIICISIVLCAALGAVISEAAPEEPKLSDVASSLTGQVSDEQGQPLVGALVSVFGQSVAGGALIAITNKEGRFNVANIPPGLYRLRAYLSGFSPSAYAKVLIHGGVVGATSVLMKLTALEGSENSLDVTERTIGELKWLVSHEDRNILKSKEAGFLIDLEKRTQDVSVWQDFQMPFIGETGFMSSVDSRSLQFIPGIGNGLDASMAFASVQVPTTTSNYWLVGAQVLDASLPSWVGHVEYVNRDLLRDHRLVAGMAYGNSLNGMMEGFQPQIGAVTNGGVSATSMTEWFGRAFASDHFTIGRLDVEAGLDFQYLGYLDSSSYLSPTFRLSYALDKNRKTMMHGDLDYQVLAPGSADIAILSQMGHSDFAGIGQGPQTIKAERAMRYQLALERHVGRQASVEVKVFQERASDQLVKTYLDANAAVGTRRFAVTNQGDFLTRGVGLWISQRFAGMEGTVGYTYGIGRALSTSHQMTKTRLNDDIHDLTTTVVTEIARTSTRLQAAYRLFSHPSFFRRQEYVGHNTVDSRFNLQVVQVLPFIGWNGTRWEVMVALRNLFYDDFAGTPFLDEIAIIDAPKRVLGGVTIHF